MKNLDRMMTVWSGLENAYGKYCKNYQEVSRKEYLKDLLAYEDGHSDLTALRSLLKSEVSEYNDEEAMNYASLFELMKKTVIVLDNFKGEIVNLDEFINFESNSTATKSIGEKMKETDILLSSTIGEAASYLSKGIFTDAVYEENGKLMDVHFNQKDPYYRFFSDISNVINFAKSFNIHTATDFEKQVYATILYCNSNNVLPGKFAVVSREMFVIRKRSVCIGNTKVGFSRKDLIDIPEFKIRDKDGSIFKFHLNFMVKTLHGKFRDETVIFLM